MQFRRRSSIIALLMALAASEAGAAPAQANTNSTSAAASNAKAASVKTAVKNKAVANPVKATAYSPCACGYIDDQKHVWRESLVSDFSTGSAVATLNKDWTVSTNTWESVPYARTHVAANVYQGKNTLVLKTSAYSGTGAVQASEVITQRGDILYGTFRMNAIIPSTPGVVFAFFSYNGTVDDAETDIEFRSSDLTPYNTVHLTAQPYATKVMTIPGAQFTKNYYDHRFDWMPGMNALFVNNIQRANVTQDVPKVPSRVIINNWSSGNAWTEGPPTADALAYVRNVKMYFNSTSISDAQFTATCKASKQTSRCSI